MWQLLTSSFINFINNTHQKMSFFNRWRYSCKENWLKCCKFTYNKETGECLGRSCKKWLSLLAFYLLYVLFTLSGFFGILFVMVHIMEEQGLDSLKSKLTLFTGACPGLAIIPKLSLQKAPLLWYKSDDPKTQNEYVEKIDQFLAKYDGNKTGSNVYVDCSKTKRRRGQYCTFTRNDLGPCGNSSYGYDSFQPCFYITLNKIIGWDPKDYRPEGSSDSDRIENEIIMVTCKAIHHYDAEHLGPIKYYPTNGFHEYFFPYDGSDLYLPPAIAVQFPEMKTGYVIGIKCLSYDVGINRDNEAYYTDTVYMYIKN
nr:sodium/potassium-transporting ATPase subunit beta-1-like [Onthophagus taurus]